mmetsp:Transcript_30110/g.48556  ORF Transcript_30110/g.48556 Transcript_30110/m.48556 type:complete len:87 (-) Transcript_30110:583-843(-)
MWATALCLRTCVLVLATKMPGSRQCSVGAQACASDRLGPFTQQLVRSTHTPAPARQERTHKCILASYALPVLLTISKIRARGGKGL